MYAQVQSVVICRSIKNNKKENECINHITSLVSFFITCLYIWVTIDKNLETDQLIFYVTVFDTETWQSGKHCQTHTVILILKQCHLCLQQHMDVHFKDT